MHTPLEPVIIIDRVMQGRPIVPKYDTSNVPLEPARELRLHLVLKQVLQQRCALFWRPAVESIRVRNVEVQTLLACLAMRAYS